LLDGIAPHVIVFSHGSGFDRLADPHLMEPTAAWAREKGVPYFSIVQSLPESRDLDPNARRLLGGFYDSAAGVGFVSERNRDVLARSLGSALPNAFIVRNPVRDLGVVPMPPMGTRRLACVGRLDVGSKGQDVLIEALSRVDAEDWRLSLYGEGDDHALLRDTADRLGVGDRVHFRGFCDIADIWAAEHVLVSASHYEGISTAAVEAMLAARPVMSTDVGGIREWVTDGVEGLIIDRSSVDQVADGLRRLFRQPDLIGMGLRARDRALQQVDRDPGRTLLERLHSAPVPRRVGNPRY
jgi:glycosyltransferase involved in cell wall biosynthesis